MQRRTFRHLVILLAVCWCAASAAAQEKIEPQQVSGKIEWVYDYAAGQELAKQTSKPMLVVFRCER